MAGILGNVGVNLSQSLPGIWLGIQIGMMLLGFTAVALVIFFMIRYPYRVEIIEKRGKGRVIYYDWGRVLQPEPNMYRLNLLFKRKSHIELPNYNYITTLTGNLFRKKQVTLYRTSENGFSFVDWEDDLKDGRLKGNAIEMDVETLINTVQQQQRKKVQQKTFYEYMLVASPIIQIFLLIILVYFSLKGVNQIVNAAAQVSGGLQNAASQLAACTVPPAAPGFTG